MNRLICVYSSSSCTVDKKYFEAATALGMEIAIRGNALVFGAGTIGLMGETARAVQKNNGKVVGVIPEALNLKGIVYEECDELIETKGMRERKSIMDSRSDAFIALPGGYGTLEEILEIITLKQLKYHNKPIVILNIDGFFNPLIEQFDHIERQMFAKPESRQLYYITDDVREALSYIDSYKPFEPVNKWFTDIEK